MALPFEKRVLPNGLTLVAEANPAAHTAAVGFFVKVGTRDETRDIMGVTHFLEHMMFKGTPRRSAADVNREFDEMGANYNAYTSHENTVYYAQVLPEFLPRVVDLLGDMLRPALRSEDFDVEKKVILEEISMYEDQPFARLNNVVLEEHFGDHPLSYRVLGTNESIAAMPVERMREFFGHRYSPDNIIVAAAGKVEMDRLAEDVAKVAGHWKATGARRAHGQPAAGAGMRRIVADAKATRCYMEMIWPGPSAQDDRRYAASVLADVIGDSEGSRLYWALVDPAIADDAEMSFMPQDGLGSFLASASCEPERAEQVEELVGKTLDATVATLEPAEVERAKNKLATSMILRSENPLGCMRSVGNQWLYRQSYLPLEQQFARLNAVTVADLKALVEAFPFQPRTVARLRPGA